MPVVANLDIRSICEIGAGSGANLEALRWLLGDIEIGGVEINERACAALLNKKFPFITAAVPGWEPARQYDLVLTKGLLIHIPPSDLPAVYETIAKAARRYVLMCEYYNPMPVEIPYRGQAGLLWKRDFAGEFLDTHRQFSLRSYGFTYHRDRFPQDDVTWFLMELT